MQYLLLIYEAEEIWENKTDDEKRALLARHGILNEKLVADDVEYNGQVMEINILRSTCYTLCALRSRVGLSSGAVRVLRRLEAYLLLMKVNAQM